MNIKNKECYNKYYLFYIPVLLITIYLKYVLMERMGFRIVSRQYGRIGINALSILEKLSFFRIELAIGLIIIPILIYVIVRYNKHKIINFLLLLVYLILPIIFTINYKCYEETGRFFSYSTLYDAVSWGVNNPDFIWIYIGKQFLIKIFILFIIIISIIIYSIKKNIFNRLENNIKYNNKYRYSAIVVIVIIVLVPWLSVVPKTPYHNSVYYMIFDSFFGSDNKYSEEYDNKSINALIKLYNNMSNRYSTNKNKIYYGKEEDTDVIIFIIETAPSKYMSISKNIAYLRNISRIYKKSFNAITHFTTYPYTNRAWFSILSSLYPSTHRYNYTERPPKKVVPGVISSLNMKGYKTAYYAPYKGRLEDDEGMFDSLGFQSQKYTDFSKFPSNDNSINNNSFSNRKINDDIGALNPLLADINGWIKENKRYFVAFAPQISHAPWLDITDDGREKTMEEKSRALLVLMDSWVGEIINILETNNRIDKTIIVISGDHGIRTREEDPTFSGGMIDQYSFEVPLLVYAPNTLKSTVTITWPTSHIDISPTILDLLGVELNRDIEQGLPIWDNNLKNRITYLFANHYLGADGYYKSGKYYMLNNISGAVFANSSLNFTENNIVTSSSYVNTEVTENLKKIILLQEALGKKLK